MLVKNSLIAIFALSAGTLLLQGLKSPVPAAPSPPARQVPPRQAAPLRWLYGSPTRTPVARWLQKRTVHVYPLPLKAGEFVTVIALQEGVDLLVTVAGADGKPLLAMDSPNGNRGPERVPFVADATTTYRVEVSGVSDQETGLYRIWIDQERVATRRDRQNSTAEILFFKAKTKDGSTENELRRAEALWRQAGNEERRADALGTLGQFYFDRSKWKAALPLWRKATTLYHRTRAFAREGMLDNKIGFTYERHSQIEAAKASYQRAFLNGQRGGDRRVVAVALFGLGITLRAQGKSVEALENLRQASAEFQDLNPVREAQTITAIGGLFADAGKPKEAMADFKEALSLLPHGEVSSTKAFVWSGMADLYSQLKEQEQARHYYGEALQVQRKIKDSRGMAASLDGIAKTYLNDKRPQEAIDAFQDALYLYHRDDNPGAEAVVLTNLGWAHALLGQEQDARSAYERALILAKGRNAQVEAAAYLGLTRLEEARDDPIAAQKQAEAAVRSVEGMRALVGRDLQIPFFATKQDVYDALIEVLLQEDQLHPAAGFAARALQVSEQARSRSLLDSVSSSRKAGPRADLPIPAILSLSEIQRSVLDPETILLEYHLGRMASYLWVVAQNSFHVVKLPPRQQIEDLTRKVSGLLMVSGHQEKFHEALQAAENLSRMLLVPAEAWLGKKRLVISSPAILQTIPFGALPDPLTLDGKGGHGQWDQPLIFEHEVIRIPSASVVAAIRNRAAGRKPPPNLLAVIADPVSSERDPRLTGRATSSPATRSEAALDSLYGEFDRLGHAKEEADAILSEAGSKGVWSATGFDATRELVLSGRLRSYRNLHFSMHGLLGADDSKGTALVLSLRDRRSHYREGFLWPSEIDGLELPADLVVLSACNTGRGESVPGEGVVGLPQAFLVAGATQVMMSLWPIDDRATASLMKIFYHMYLAKGLPPTAALREAQKELFRTFQSPQKAPFYWGGFEIQGDWISTSARR
ncbi:MAG TPA: CHAT domain-containing tetratricopeptide repeat protein [Thermoanaerobaculia bacterium]|jgi:CHAT domain-containing protein|nr:CHAT domain-containing tetratricopeptide repeat protein [Thermoanaerobaculia bacterium]